MRPRKPPTPSCATSWEPSSGESPSAQAGAEAARLRTNANGRGGVPTASERGAGAEAAWPAYEHKSVAPTLCEGYAWGPEPRFLLAGDFEKKKESGPDISARPAYIRGANDRIRTGDLRFTRALLYQLSHVGTRLLAKREYELYRRVCRFARGKCNFWANERAFAVSPQGCILAYATLESRRGTRSTAAAIALESCTDLRPSAGA